MYIYPMENKENKKEEINKVEDPKKVVLKASSVKRLNETIKHLKEERVLTEEELATIQLIGVRLMSTYMGMI